MEYFLQQLINGLTLGSIYGLIAIGYTMVYGIIGMINFAHGDIFTVGAFMALIVFLIITSFVGGLPVAVTLLVMIAVAVVLTSLWNCAVHSALRR
jgi:branched-chain amino acid transport system permease protein